MKVLTSANRILLHLKEVNKQSITAPYARDELCIKLITARAALDTMEFQGLMQRAGCEDSIWRPVVYKLTAKGRKEADKLNNYLKAVAV